MYSYTNNFQNLFTQFIFITYEIELLSVLSMGETRIWAKRKRSNFITNQNYTLESRQSKELLYSSFLWPVLTYEYETWLTTKGNEKKRSYFERRILRMIYRPILENEIKWNV